MKCVKFLTGGAVCKNQKRRERERKKINQNVSTANKI
jgi:hypothetical protein